MSEKRNNTPSGLHPAFLVSALAVVLIMVIMAMRSQERIAMARIQAGLEVKDGR